jgi:hypothetical protein
MGTYDHEQIRRALLKHGGASRIRIQILKAEISRRKTALKLREASGQTDYEERNKIIGLEKELLELEGPSPKIRLEK